jgi:hypothetical protein
MAKVIAVDLEVNTEKSEANLNDVVAVLGDIKKGLESNTKATKDNAEATKTLETNFQKAAKGVKGFGLALKAAGIGLAIEAFNFLKDSLESNQKFANGLSKAFETVGYVMGELLTALEPVVDIFSNLGSTVSALIRGDWSKLSESSSALVDSFKNLGNNVFEFGSNLGEITTKATEYADSIAKIRNETKLANAEAQRQLFLFQTQAELLRQTRDDFTKPMEERIAASLALKETLDLQYQTELELRRRNLELAQLELSSNKENVDLQIAVIEAETELADLRERITGQRSEQLNSEIALLKEREELEGGRVERIQQRGLQEVEVQRTIAGEKMAINDSEFKSDEALTQAKLAMQATVNNALIAATNLLGESTAAGKTVALAQLLFSQGAALANALRNSQSPTPDNIATGGLAGIGKFAVIATSILATATQAKRIINSAPKPKGVSMPSGGGGGSGGGSGGGLSSSFGFNPSTPTISAIPTSSQIAAQGGQQSNVRAYVVQTDINNQTALDKRINQRATL